MPELNDSLAWYIAAAAALCMFLCLVFLTRNFRFWWLKWVFRLVPPIALLLPASVPDASGFYAPAFIVAPFEMFLQDNGAPAEAIRRLSNVLGAVIGLITLAALARWGKNRKSAPQG